MLIPRRPHEGGLGERGTYLRRAGRRSAKIGELSSFLPPSLLTIMSSLDLSPAFQALASLSETQLCVDTPDRSSQTRATPTKLSTADLVSTVAIAPAYRRPQQLILALSAQGRAACPSERMHPDSRSSTAGC